MTDESETRKQWLDRAHALGRAQTTYLWGTLVTAIFFFALRQSCAKGQDVSVPIIDLKLDARAVLATGPFVLALLVVATIGSMQAWGAALKKYAGDSCSDADTTDRLDQFPTVLDLAHFAARQGPRWLDPTILVLGYPGFMTLVVIEAVWILCWLWLNDVPGRIVLILIAVPALLGAIVLVAQMWKKRLRQATAIWRKSGLSGTGSPDQRAPELLYLFTTLLLLVHQIDSAYWQEWRLFRLPGGIEVFLVANAILIAPFLFGLLRMQTEPRIGARFGIALSVIGIGAFSLHTWLWLQGHLEFRTPVSIAILSGALIASLGLGWQCTKFLRVSVSQRSKEDANDDSLGAG